MAYRLSAGVALDVDLRRIASEQAARALESLGDDAATPEGVHEARKRLKMLRALARLVRDPLGSATYRDENARFRDIGRRLSDVRDADVLVRLVDDLRKGLSAPDRAAVVPVRRRLLRNRNERRSSELAAAACVARDALADVREHVGRWPLDGVSVGLLVDAVGQTYGRGRRAFRDATADPADEPLHECRKRGKDLWYQLRLLRDAWPCVTAAWIAETHRLSDLLGDDHDLAVLSDVLGQDGHPDVQHGAAGLRRTIASRRAELQREARLLGTRVFAEKRRHFESRLQAYCRAWRGEESA